MGSSSISHRERRVPNTQSQVPSQLLGKSSANALRCLRRGGVRGVAGMAWRGVDKTPSSIAAQVDREAKIDQILSELLYEKNACRASLIALQTI